MKFITHLSVIAFLGMLSVMPCALAINNGSEVLSISTEVGSVQKDILHQSQVQKSAKEWGLGTDEYTRYQELMKGPRGIQSPGLDPITTLGIEAKNDAERRRYAEQWVKTEFARTEKELVFQREVAAAWKRLYLEILPVNLGNAAGIVHDTQGRLALFVRIDDCVQCDARLTAILTENRSVDIYVVDSNGDDNRIREWAKDKKISIERVRTKQVTLNHDEGRWIKYGGIGMPVVLQQNSDGNWRIAAF
ncbi:TIGR03759 family integrating conjugative element protein [Xenorhabdus khoisanae]|uniref:TIGR03759 family integrating conjugative element protein n=1 Tax=Xenorhabdus khoisanae TaxID=880157 RepID=UPI002359396C|nr:TIGR03759 family integrating conjugative element protein [Xenorhabdus khoisanae]MDC9612929.1 TIGR03759 family integrating conjugative element protein [Xenorhabdus khoisanae]